MELYETELKDARARLAALGRDPESFAVAMEFLPPDPDGGGMFTVHYEVTVENTANGKGARFIGGIGMRWVDYFEDEVKAGTFD
jgi:hypothetical protein